MTKARLELGRWGETLAAAHLQQQGYQILDRNVRTHYGELDLVARCGQVTVFVEVKTRASAQFGYPESAITTRKRAHILASAQAYLQAHPDLDGDWRVDVIAIQRVGSQPKIQHFENAIL